MCAAKIFTVNLAILLLGVFSAELSLEYGLIGSIPYNSNGFIDRFELVRRSAASRGAPFDPRNPESTVPVKERERGHRAFPAISPGYFLEAGGSRIKSNGVDVLPLGIVPNAASYYCNESGTPAKFDTDRHGLRNPDAVWDVPRTDVFLAGDSFTFGSCLPEEQSIAGRVRAKVPATINAGQGANGPLIELATIREYAVPRKARQVFWLFFENDLDDLSREVTNPILKKYLEPNFSQNLIIRHKEIGPLVEAAADQYLKSIAGQAPLTISTESVLMVPRMRGLIEARRSGIYDPPTKPVDIESFVKVVERARDDVVAYGGAFTLVYLPDCNPVTYRRDAWRDEWLKRMQASGIAVLDGEGPIRALGRKAFFYCPHSHYAPAGAEAIAELIKTSIAN